MSDVPILVESFTPDQAVAIICRACGWTGKDTDPASGYIGNGLVPCPKCDNGEHYVEYQYEAGERCAGCRKLDYRMPLSDDHGSYCSRRCQLQAEYARSLTTPSGAVGVAPNPRSVVPVASREEKSR